MTPQEQIPQMDKDLAKINKRIYKAQRTIWKLEDRMRCILNRMERVRRYSRELGRKRSYIANFQLELDQ